MGKKACVIMIFVFCLALFGCAAVINGSSSTVSSSDSFLVSSASSSQVSSTPSSKMVSSQPSSSSSAVNSLSSKSSSIGKTKNKSIDDYIETAYSVNISKPSEHTRSYTVPHIKGIDSPYVREVNAELNKMIEKFKKYDEEIEYNYSGHLIQENNLIYLNNDVLSLVLHGHYDSGSSRWQEVYNINVITGKKVTNEDILKSKNISDREYIEKLKQVTKDYFLKCFPYNGMSSIYTQEYNGYVNKTITSEYCNLENPIFLDGDGNVNAVIEYLSLAGPDRNSDIAVIVVSGK